MRNVFFKPARVFLLLNLLYVLFLGGALAQNISGGPSVVWEPEQLTFTLNSTDAPSSQTCTLTNTGGEPLAFQINAPESPAQLSAAVPNPLLESATATLNTGSSNVYHPGRLIIGLKENRVSLADNSLFALIGAQNVRYLATAKNPFTARKFFTKRSILLVTLTDQTPQKVSASISVLQKDGNVAYAEPDYRLHTLATLPNDPDFGLLYGLNNTGQGSGLPGCDIDAPEAWDLTTGSSQVIVGVIDTGIDYRHPDLQANIWTNPGEIAGNGIDDDRNGFIDDIHGWDFANNDNDPMDDHGHGTHCAGTIAAVGNNGIGVTGVVWKARLAALKYLDSSGSGYTSDAINAISYANAMGFPITNNSWGGDFYSQSLYEVINDGGLFVAAAGNDYGKNNDLEPTYPASYENVNLLAVAASDDHDYLAYFSNYGPASVDLAAPGAGIWSCAPGGGYRYMSGTSMATPHVSGAAALLLSANPWLSASQLKSALIRSVDPVPDLQGKVVGNGRLNVFKALSQLTPSWLSLSPLNGNIAPNASQAITVTVNPANLEPGRWQKTLAIQTNDPDHPVLQLQITVNINPSRQLAVAPTRYDFGNVPLNQTKSTSLTLSNSGNSPTTITSLVFNQSEFDYSGAMPLTVPAKGSISVDIAFTPRTTGSKSAMLTINSNAQNNLALQVNLAGNGFISALEVTPERISENLSPETTSLRNLTLKNTSTASTGYSLTTSNGLGWLVVNPTSGTIPAGATAVIQVTFNATNLSPGNYRDTINLTASTGFTKTIPCTLTVSSDIRKLGVTPQSYDYGNVLIGQSKTMSFTLTNAGTLATTITALTLSNTQFTHNVTLPITIPSSSTATIQVAYHPAIAQAASSILAITSNAQDNPLIQIQLSGAGIASPYSLQPESFAITLPGNSSSTASLRLFNHTSAAAGFIIKRNTAAGAGIASTGGPDKYGYVWADSDQSGGPVYTWQEISATGRRLVQSDGDDAMEAINLSFSFPFYDRSFTTVYVSSNGFLTFAGNTLNPYINYTLPCQNMPDYTIAGFHDDLFPDRQGDIYCLDDGNRFIVQYQNVAVGSYGTATFQIVLEKTGAFLMYYKTMSGTVNRATIGFQNGSHNDGLTIVCDGNYVKNNLAIQVTPPVDWLNLNPAQGTIPASGVLDVLLTFKSTGIAPGIHNTNLQIYFADQTAPLIVPCQLTVY